MKKVSIYQLIGIPAILISAWYFYLYVSLVG